MSLWKRFLAYWFPVHMPPVTKHIPAPVPTVAESGAEWQAVKASSFADPKDVAAFRRCKARGRSDQECFKVGDNGVGFTGLPCWRDDVCYAALPPEEWRTRFGTKRYAAGKALQVRYKGKVVEGKLGDTMPAKTNIKNGAGIDLNPGFAKALGLEPPFMVDVEWRWL